MKIINRPRGSCKSIRLLYASEWNNIPILCANRKHKQYLVETAKELGLCIPEPIAVAELTPESARNSDIAEKDMLVDEAHWVLQHILKNMGIKGNIQAVTFTADEN